MHADHFLPPSKGSILISPSVHQVAQQVSFVSTHFDRFFQRSDYRVCRHCHRQSLSSSWRSMAKKAEKSQALNPQPPKPKSSLSRAQTNPLAKKSASTSKQSSKQNAAQRVAALERSIIESGTQDLNPLVDLLAYLNPDNTSKVIHSAAYACQRTFSSLARSGKLTPVPQAAGEGEAIKQVRDWLRARLVEFAEKLASLLRYSEASIRVCVQIHCRPIDLMLTLFF